MLINKDLLKRFGLFPKNYDLTEVMPYVDISEKIWIVKTIGMEQYEELQEQVDENRLTPENSTLLVEAIYPYLAMAVVYESLPTTWAHLSEIGWTRGKSDNSDSLTLKEMTYVSDHVRRQLEVRKDFAIQWIKDHIEYFPLICQCMNCDCCCKKERLNKPNPLQELYTTRRKCTDLK
jgi:hypothetical protein